MTCVVGLGRVGLPTAALIARAGARVHGCDADPEVLARIRDGVAGDDEPGLGALVRHAVRRGMLTVSASAAPAETTVLCVPTPVDGAHRPDLGALWAAVEAIDPVVPPDGLVVVASTVPVGTTDAVARRLRRDHPARRVACCPERVLPGDAVREMRVNPRLAGGVDPESAAAAAAWLAGWAEGPIDRVDARTAELVKLVENGARDVALAYAHTVAAVAEVHGLDPAAVRALANRHPRVSLLSPGIGVGGHCLPVDPWFLADGAPDATELVRVARRVNDAVPGRWVDRIAAVADGLGARAIGLLGLAYKPGTDDVRGAPAVEIARALAERFEVVAADPRVRAVDGIEVAPVAQALACPVVVLLVAHPELVAARASVPPGARVIDACGGWA